MDVAIKEYAERLSVKFDDLIGSSRKKEVALAREYCWYLLHEKGVKYRSIAVAFGRRSHTTILSGVQTIEGLIEIKDRTVKELAERINNYEQN